MDAQPGVIDRSNAYISRAELSALVAAHRPRSPSGVRSAAAGSVGGSSAAASVHTLQLGGMVLQDSSEDAMLDVQRLLRALVPSLDSLLAARSNLTGRIFFHGRRFRVQQPEAEHVSVEAVQSSQASGSSTAGSTSSGDAGGVRSIVRDDHPPLILAMRRDDDLQSDDEDEEEDGDEEGSDSEEGETNDTESSSAEEEEGTAEAGGEGQPTRRRRRRRLPEIVDLEQTPLLQLLAKQSSQSRGGALAAADTAAHAGALSSSPYHYFFYVQTLYDSEDEVFYRSYVRLNWLPVSRIDMSGTEISGYGVVSLVASCCSSLQSLQLSDCASVDDTAVYAIVNLCTQLRHLDLSHCSKITRFGLMYLAEFDLNVIQNCLELIDVSHCGGNDTLAAEPSAAPTSALSPTSPRLVSIALFNALEERGFRGRFVWQRLPKAEEMVGQPLIIKVAVPQPAAAAVASSSLSNVFVPPAPVYEERLSSPFLQHYQQLPHRIVDLAMRDITDRVLTEVPWSWIKQQDSKRAQRLEPHLLQMGNITQLHMPVGSSGFARSIEAEIQAAEAVRWANQSPPADYQPPVPRFFALNLSNHLINDRLLYYILANWGPRLYSLTLDGVYITAAGLRELRHCPHLHLLSLTTCLNIVDKTRANAALKDALSHITFLSELNLTNSRLSGRMMSAHPNLKLDVLIANGCPISSFAIRMLSSSTPTIATGAASAEATQSMCKYSLRLLSLSNCAFVNRRALDYLLKFAYLQLIDVSDCKGLKREDVVNAFTSAAESEIRFMESKLSGRKSRSGGSAGASATARAPSSFASLLCNLRHVLVFGLGGSGFSERRAAEFARDLNAWAARLQQLLLLHHHQTLAAAEESSGQAGAASNNLAPPPALRQAPQEPAGVLRRDFSKDPIIVIANRASPLLQHYQPTLTRFVVQGSGASASVVAVPSGLTIGAASTLPLDSSSAAPPLQRGSSLLDECPYSFLPPTLPSANTTVTPTPTPPPHTSAAVMRSTQPSPFGMQSASSPLPHPTAYMMMQNEEAAGGTMLSSASSTLVPPSAITPQPQHTWQTFGSGAMPPSGLPQSVSMPAGFAPNTGAAAGELYFALPYSSVSEARAAAASAQSSHAQAHAQAEGAPVASSTSAAASASAPGFLASLSSLSLGPPPSGPPPAPYAGLSSDMPAPFALPMASVPTEQLLPPVAALNLAAPLDSVAAASAPVAPAPVAPVNSLPLAFSSALPAHPPALQQQQSSSNLAFPSFVSPFAALQTRPPSSTPSAPLFPSPASFLSPPGVTASAEGVVSPVRASPSNSVSPQQPGQPPSPALATPAASPPPAAAGEPAR